MKELSDFQQYHAIKNTNRAYEQAKALAIQFGATAESFEKTDAAIDELIRALEKKCIGGVFAAEQTKVNHEQHKD